MARCSVSILVPLQGRRRANLPPLLLPHGLHAVVGNIIVDDFNKALQPELLLCGSVPIADLHPAGLCQLLRLVAPA